MRFWPRSCLCTAQNSRVLMGFSSRGIQSIRPWRRPHPQRGKKSGNHCQYTARHYAPLGASVVSCTLFGQDGHTSFLKRIRTRLSFLRYLATGTSTVHAGNSGRLSVRTDQPDRQREEDAAGEIGYGCYHHRGLFKGYRLLDLSEARSRLHRRRVCK